MSHKRSVGCHGRSGREAGVAVFAARSVCLLIGVLASLNAEASIVITQAESRAVPGLWLLNLGGQQGLAHQQVFNGHDVSDVAVFNADSLDGVHVVYLSPTSGALVLTTPEINALVAFVTDGGRLIVAADNSVYAEDFAELAARFDVTYGDGILEGQLEATVVDFSNPITAGPAGVVKSFLTAGPNDGLASENPDFRILATFPKGETALGFLETGAGEVVFLTDFNTFDDERLPVLDNQILWTNLFALSCPADIDGNGAVDFGDILRVLDAWGNKGGPEDLDGSGTVDFGDLLIVLDSWGPCE